MPLFHILKLGLATFMVFSFIMDHSAHAQSRGAEISLIEAPVRKRINEDYIPDGMEYHGFIIRPILDVTTTYNDNIYAQQNSTVSDFMVVTSPAVQIEKKYGPHSFHLSGGGRFVQFKDNSDENQNGFNVKTDGFLSFRGLTTVLYNASYRKSFLPRENPGNSRLTQKPIRQYTSKGEAGIIKKFNRVNLGLIGSTTRKTFSDGVDKDTNAPLIFSNRNRNIYNTTLKVGYDILGEDIKNPEHILFADFSYTQNRFDDTDSNGLSSDSDQIGVLAGIITRYKGIIFGKLGIGYFKQDFQDAKDISRLDIQADIGVNITPKTTVSFEALRDVIQDNSFVTGYVRTDFTARVDHELWHDTYIGVKQDYINRDFLGPQEGRIDKTYGSSVYLSHNHSRNLESRIEIKHEFQDSNRAGTDYDQNSILFRLVGRL